MNESITYYHMNIIQMLVSKLWNRHV